MWLKVIKFLGLRRKKKVKKDDSSTMYLVSVKERFGTFRHFEVPKEVYVYVKQLEAYINYPDESKLLEAYPERFKNNKKKDKFDH